MSLAPLPPCPPPKYRLGTAVTNCFRTEAVLPHAPAVVRARLRAALPAGPIVGWPVQVRAEAATFTARYLVYLFVDTLEAAVLPEGTGSRVVLRSTSHVGRNDFGLNRRRVNLMLAALQAPS